MMRGLSAQELLLIWELALRQHPIDRALTMLAVAMPEVPRDELLALSIGQRDARLLTVREATFGSRLAGFAECPACQERLEFVFDVADIRVGATNEDGTEGAINRPPQIQEVSVDRYELRFRLPTSLDMAEVARCREVLIARDLLVQRCVLQARRDGVEVSALPDAVVVALGGHMLEADPQAEIQIDLSCPTCAHQWLVIFDIVAFFWSEISVQAKRLLREVHMLASAYGWHEADILAMSAARRQFYLEMVT